ncbi:MAG: hypothetical protein C5B54_08360 [Acidobacteria bacterium]|nr:MAG: hypothetical protein C5B54_08360 [Acidobacteriota bacterium]
MKHTAPTPFRVVAHRTLPNLEITEFQQPPEHRIQPHTHNTAILTVVLNGSFQEVVDRKKYHCEPGTLLVKPAGAVHSHRYSSHGAHCLLIEISDQSIEEARIYDRRKLKPAVVSLQREIGISDQCSESIISELVQSIFHETAIQHSDSLRKCPGWLKRAKDYIHDCNVAGVRLTQIAHFAGVHPTHLCEIFPRYFGCTIGEYARRLRLEKAFREITESSRPLIDIALAAGFYDQSHFHRLFKRFTGLTPMQARRCAKTLRA